MSCLDNFHNIRVMKPSLALGDLSPGIYQLYCVLGSRIQLNAKEYTLNLVEVGLSSLDMKTPYKVYKIVWWI
jgi:hypothetical protein